MLLQVHVVRKASIADLPQSASSSLPLVLEFDSLLMGETLAKINTQEGLPPTPPDAAGGLIPTASPWSASGRCLIRQYFEFAVCYRDHYFQPERPLPDLLTIFCNFPFCGL